MDAITLIAGAFPDIAPGSKIGLICEAAPDSSVGSAFPDAASFTTLFGDRSKTRRHAADLAHRLVVDEPMAHGMQHLRVFEEVLIGELESTLFVINLAQWLKANQFFSCRLSGKTWLSAYVDLLAAESGIKIESQMCSGSGGRASSLRARACRVLSRLRQSGLSRSVLQKEWRQFIDHIDPYHRRPSVVRRGRKRTNGEIWFYTTAHTFTDTGLAYEPFFPRPFQFLVENPLRGGGPLKKLERSWTSPYAFSSAGCKPTQQEIEAARKCITEHLRGVALNGAEARARDALLRSDCFAEFNGRLLPMGIYYTRLFDNWAESVRPRALVVGNFVFEAYATLAARKRGIPTILLQHGTVGETQTGDLPVDYYALRGKFWRDFLSPKVRKKSKVINHSPLHLPALPKKPRSSLLFLSAPYSMQCFWSESDLDDILSVLLRCAGERGAELIVRVHPLENVGYYRGRIERLAKGDRRGCRISYSQGGRLDSLLARAALVVTYSSTAFLECLRWQVPIVSFDWHYFDYKQKLRERGVFHFSGSLSELGDLVSRGLSGKLAPFEGGVEPFLASTPEAELRQEIETMLTPGAAGIRQHPERTLQIAAGDDAA